MSTDTSSISSCGSCAFLDDSRQPLICDVRRRALLRLVHDRKPELAVCHVTIRTPACPSFALLCDLEHVTRGDCCDTALLKVFAP